MNGFFKQNLECAAGKFPRAGKKLLAGRLKNIRWPVARRARVCEVTVNSSCDNRCLFCYMPGRARAGAEPGFKEVCRTLYEGRRRGCWIAAVIGGEPSLRGDIGKIASFAAKIGYDCVKICTNGGRLADPAYVRHLAESGFNMFDISLHGADAAAHDRLVGVKGSFSRVMRAAGNVRAAGLELGTNHVINALNYAGFPSFFRMALNDLGINYYNVIYGHYRGSMSRNKTALKVRMSETVPAVRDGLAELGRAGLPAFSRILVNYPPCLLPEYMDILADWEKEKGGGERLLLADGRTLDMAEMKTTLAVKSRSCGGCVLNANCRGVDAEYLELFGSSEFKPLASVPKGNRARTIF